MYSAEVTEVKCWEVQQASDTEVGDTNSSTINHNGCLTTLDPYERRHSYHKTFLGNNRKNGVTAG